MATHEPSIADAIRSAVRDAQDLVRSEIALAKAEVREEVGRLSQGAAYLAIAAVAGIIGLVFLMTTIAWGIAELLAWPAWAGFGIVTLLLL
ncbi:MAG: phage holin family protein, partial [Vicinamibacterales bacterium]